MISYSNNKICCQAWVGWSAMPVGIFCPYLSLPVRPKYGLQLDFDNPVVSWFLVHK